MAFSKKPAKKSADHWDCACRRNPAYLLFCPKCGQAPAKPNAKQPKETK